MKELSWKWVDISREFDLIINFDDMNGGWAIEIHDADERKLFRIVPSHINYSPPEYQLRVDGHTGRFRILKRVEEPDEVSVLLTKEEINDVLSALYCSTRVKHKIIDRFRNARDSK